MGRLQKEHRGGAFSTLTESAAYFGMHAKEFVSSLVPDVMPNIALVCLLGENCTDVGCVQPRLIRAKHT